MTEGHSPHVRCAAPQLTRSGTAPRPVHGMSKTCSREHPLRRVGGQGLGLGPGPRAVVGGGVVPAQLGEHAVDKVVDAQCVHLDAVRRRYRPVLHRLRRLRLLGYSVNLTGTI
jgi:hypothetical protein